MAVRCWENAEGEETARKEAAEQTFGKAKQRQKSGNTLERSERLREESPRKSNSKDPRGSEDLRDQPKGKVREEAKNQ